MNIRTIKANSPAELDKQVNQADKELRPQYTQTHVVLNQATLEYTYIAVLFYVPRLPATPESSFGSNPLE